MNPVSYILDADVPILVLTFQPLCDGLQGLALDKVLLRAHLLELLLSVQKLVFEAFLCHSVERLVEVLDRLEVRIKHRINIFIFCHGRIVARRMIITLREIADSPGMKDLLPIGSGPRNRLGERLSLFERHLVEIRLTVAACGLRSIYVKLHRDVLFAALANILGRSAR